MSLRFVTETFAVDPNDVSCIEDYKVQALSPSGGIRYHDQDEVGSIVVLKNGRKIYVKDFTPQQCHNMIFG